MPHRILIESFDDEEIILNWLEENVGVGATLGRNLEWIAFFQPSWYLGDRYYSGSKPHGAYFYFKCEEDALAFKLRWI